MAENSCCCCSGNEKTTERDEDLKRNLLNRLKRIEGQIRGLERMVENDAYCNDILTQSAAAGSALDSFNSVLLEAHIRGCVVRDIKNGDTEIISELCDTVRKLIK